MQCMCWLVCIQYVCMQGVGVYMGEHVFATSVPTQMSGRSVWGGRSWSPGHRSLAPLPEDDLISGQAASSRPQWGTAWAWKLKNEGSRRTDRSSKMGQTWRTGKDTFACYTILLGPPNLIQVAMTEEQSVSLWSPPITSALSALLHYTTM